MTNKRQISSERILLDAIEAAGTESGSECLEDNHESPKSPL